MYALIFQNELVNRPLSDILVTDCTDIQLKSQQNKEFEGEISFKGNLIDMLNVHCRTVPVACMNSNITHVILTLVVTTPHIGADDVLATLPPPQQQQQLQLHKPEPRGSLHSIRRGSFDIRPFGLSDGMRRTSIAKLSALPLEAPITKVRPFVPYYYRLPFSIKIHLLITVII